MIIRNNEDLASAFSKMHSSDIQETITPDDDVILRKDIKALWIGGEGDLIAVDKSGTQNTFTVGSGIILPIIPTKILAATTATNIIALI